MQKMSTSKCLISEGTRTGKVSKVCVRGQASSSRTGQQSFVGKSNYMARQINPNFNILFEGTTEGG